MSPCTNYCVAGSSGICPLVKMKSPSEMACEYGPIAFGAFSVEITLIYWTRTQRWPSALLSRYS